VKYQLERYSGDNSEDVMGVSLQLGCSDRCPTRSAWSMSETGPRATQRQQALRAANGGALVDVTTVPRYRVARPAYRGRAMAARGRSGRVSRTVRRGENPGGHHTLASWRMLRARRR